MFLRLCAALLPLLFSGLCSGCSENGSTPNMLYPNARTDLLPRVPLYDPAVLLLHEYQALLRDEDVSPERFATYLRAYPQTPDAVLLRSRGEEAAIRVYAPPRLVQYFDANPPTTPGGRIAYAEALRIVGRLDAARAQARLVYLQANTDDTQARRAEALGITAQERWQRLVLLIDADKSAEARAMAARVPAAWMQAAERYLNARTQASAIAAQPLPRPLNAPAAFARMRALRKLDRDAEAAELFLHLPENILAAMPLARLRESAAATRAFDVAGDALSAYKAAARYRAPGAVVKADVEAVAARAARIAGLLPQALAHADAAAAASKMPVTQARAQYERGKTLKSLGRTDEGTAVLSAAALRFPYTFYGQIAGADAGLFELPLPAEPSDNPSSFAQALFVRVASVAASRNDFDTAVRFLVAYAREGSNVKRAADAADGLTGPYARLLVGKAALSSSGTVSLSALYPMPPFYSNISVDPAFALAISRQESEFNPRAVSRSGAAGLMQLMPETARLTAAQEGIALESLYNPQYNARLGSAYLRGLQNRFGGSVLAASAGYNAGPNRAQKWNLSAGDPLTQIEHIPFDETRNYVQRVWENLNVYRALLNRSSTLTLGSDALRGS